MSAREGMKESNFNVTVLGSPGMKDRLCHSFSFMGRMRHLRPIEFSMEEAMKEI